MQSANARRNALMFRQWEFIQTRQRALEIVFVGREASEGRPGIAPANVWRRLGWFLDPTKLVRDVDGVQKVLLSEGQKAAEEAAARQELTVVGPGGQVSRHAVGVKE